MPTAPIGDGVAGRLRLLDGVTHDGRRVTGERSQALLAALALDPGRALGEGVLAGLVWGPDDQPAAPAKALQVVVSRTRTQTASGVVVRVEHGYRLGDVDLDAAHLTAHVAAAVRAEQHGDAPAARDAARAALAVVVASDDDVADTLIELRDDARARQDAVRRVLGRALSSLGDHAEALPLLDVAGADDAADEPTLAALLRSEAAVRGAPAALARYERHREQVRDTLGVDPGPALQAVHAQLVAADHPVRTGLRFDATPLVGREDDVRRLRALVRQSRVTSIVGPGGLGKTRLAHLLGREAEQAVVHFVELVGVSAPEDVVGEVGSALGVRDSVSGRRALTPEQRTDVRSRIAAQLDRVPTLLILDNCEHVVEAVADLVAPLVATTRDLRVVTTTRAPLAIAAERVFPLGQLDAQAATDLFCLRARAARPGVHLDDEAVRRVVARLDGLPLALELAAARVRAMSVEDVARRLDDRFALLRDTDRAAPDRHQTLLAVIDWSWNLLDAPDQRALARLSLFYDGFTLDGAESVAGPGALAAVESLAGQSLLGVTEARDGVRYRMLETVREFGRRRLLESGDAPAARTALRAWAVDYSRAVAFGLYGARQVELVAATTDEENNLADALREALAEPDTDAAMVILAALGAYWTIRGEHARVITLVGAVEEALEGWEPTDDVVDAAARAGGVLMLNTAVADLVTPVRARALLERYGPRSLDAGTRALCRLLVALGDFGIEDAPAEMLALCEDPDRHVAMLALQWSSHALENGGDAEAAVELAERGRALWREDDGVWGLALIDTQLAGLHAQAGRLDLARRHAEAGLGVLDAIEAVDDAVQLRAVLASAAMADGDLDEAARLLDAMTSRPAAALWGGTIVTATTRAELALARGDAEGGVALYELAVDQVRSLRFPGMVIDVDTAPWILYAEGAALTALAWHGDPARGAGLQARVSEKALRVLDAGRGRVDFPLVGCLFYALATWGLLRVSADAEQADPVWADLLAVADRFGYNRSAPSMSWARAVDLVEQVLPGALDAALARLGDRRGPATLDDARAAVRRLHALSGP